MFYCFIDEDVYNVNMFLNNNNKTFFSQNDVGFCDYKSKFLITSIYTTHKF